MHPVIAAMEIFVWAAANDILCCGAFSDFAFAGAT
jgi:hypothetical protein